LLIIEDDADTREGLEELLLQEGYRVFVAPDGQAALDQLRDASTPRPRLILLDLMMPVMNGWHFRVAQLPEPALPTIPLAIMTATLHEADGLLGDEFVSKPFDYEQLLGIIRRYVPLHGPPPCKIC